MGTIVKKLIAPCLPQLLDSDKLTFCSQIKPLVAPTQAIMKARVTNFQWHEFFPRGNALSHTLHLYWNKNLLLRSHTISCAAKNNIGVVIALWAPIILVSMVMPDMSPALCCY